jgi:hypothetical protein
VRPGVLDGKLVPPPEPEIGVTDKAFVEQLEGIEHYLQEMEVGEVEDGIDWVRVRRHGQLRLPQNPLQSVLVVS